MPPKKKLKAALNKVLYENEQKKIEQHKQQTREQLRGKQKQNAIMKAHGIKKDSKKNELLRRPKSLKITADEHDKLLLVGEGNFSFARSLVEQYYLTGIEKEGTFIATCFDSKEVLYEKYGDEVKENIETIESMGGQVFYDIDATKLDKYKQINPFSYTKIIFNFPHVGKGIKDEQRNVQSNQQLLLDFFKAATPLLSVKNDQYKMKLNHHDKKKKNDNDEDNNDNIDKEEVEKEEKGGVEKEEKANYDYEKDDGDNYRKKRDGEILITLKTIKPYDQWKIKFVAKWTGALTIKSSIPFVPTDYPGYCHRRTIGFKEGLSKKENEEILKAEPKIYSFVRNHVMEEEIEKSKKGKLMAKKNPQQYQKNKKKRNRNQNDSDSDIDDDDRRIQQMKDNQI
ncbi:unnamed protein product [Cunninghamella blakesleeana]